MKNDEFNFWLICLAYFIIGLMIANNYVHHQSSKSMQKSINTLIQIEMITEQQFKILQGKLNDLERDFYNIPRDSRIAITR
jgi:hypothetical protein